jgi:carbonic anhydrase
MRIASGCASAIPIAVKATSISVRSLAAAVGAVWLSSLACAPSIAANPPADASAKTGAAPAATELSVAPGATPEHGGDVRTASYLSPEASEGRLQSPINIVTSRAVPAQHAVKFHYQTSKEHVQNLGHTVKVTYDAGSSVEFDGKTYDLVQFHFHTPSEHLLDGVTYPMEMHLVHAEHGHPDRFLVIGVLFKEGNANELINTVLADTPRLAGASTDKDVQLDASSVFKPGEGYFHYDGSLTTPPYSETVTWLVLDQVHEASAEQVEAINDIEGNNARHIQDQRARLIDHAH